MNNVSTVLSMGYEALLALSGWEVCAALCGIVYISLATRESAWCWPFAFLSTLIYSILFWQGQLPMQAILNLYYLAMAIYGFLLWHGHLKVANKLVITRWPLKNHLILITSASLLSYLIGSYMSASAVSLAPFLDASVMVFSVCTTWLMAQKVLENWLYWIVIDSAAIWLYVETHFYATVIMMIVYVLLAIVGFIHWKKTFDQSSAIQID